MSDKSSSRRESGTCLNCSHLFSKIRPHQKFCSALCRWLYWNENHPKVRLSSIEIRKLKKLLAGLSDPNEA